MRIKRYERWSKTGKSWSNWFPHKGDCDEKWQLKNKLKNEYKEVTQEEWDSIKKKQSEKSHSKIKE